MSSISRARQALSMLPYRSRRSPAFRSRSQPFSSSSSRLQDHSDPMAHRNFYKTHGRAIFKSLTLAFLSYQVFYWAWLTLETEEIKDQTKRETKSLENEVRLLDEGRKGHRPGLGTSFVDDPGKKLLEEGKTG